MSTQKIPLQPDFRDRAKASDVPIARLIGFEAKEVADAAMGMAFASTPAPEESFTTVELKINFFRPIWQAELRAEGRVVQRGRTIGYVECNTTDEENRLVAKAASTCMVLRGQKAAGR